MKFFACIALLIVLSAVDAAITNRNTQGIEAAEGMTHPQMTQAENTQVAALDSDVVRMRKSAKSAYDGGYAAPIPGPATTYTYQSPAPTVPCGKNLLFSCQPNVAHVPCSAPYPSYAGAYSEPVPVYAMPQFHTGYRRHYGY